MFTTQDLSELYYALQAEGVRPEIRERLVLALEPSDYLDFLEQPLIPGMTGTIMGIRFEVRSPRQVFVDPRMA